MSASIGSARLCYPRSSLNQREGDHYASSIRDRGTTDRWAGIRSHPEFDGRLRSGGCALALEIAASPSVSTLGRRNQRIGQQHVRGLLAHGRHIRAHGAASGDCRNRRGDARRRHDARRILRADSVSRSDRDGGSRRLPYWAMRGPFTLRPPLMVQVIWMLQDFTERNGATLVAPRSQLRCAPAQSRGFRARGDQDNRRRRRWGS